MKPTARQPLAGAPLVVVTRRQLLLGDVLVRLENGAPRVYRLETGDDVVTGAALVPCDLPDDLVDDLGEAIDRLPPVRRRVLEAMARLNVRGMVPPTIMELIDELAPDGPRHRAGMREHMVALERSGLVLRVGAHGAARNRVPAPGVAAAIARGLGDRSHRHSSLGALSPTDPVTATADEVTP